jgi:hypothetical protein
MPRRNSGPARGRYERKCGLGRVLSRSASKTQTGGELIYRLREWVFYYIPFSTSPQITSQFITLASLPSPTDTWCDLAAECLILISIIFLYPQLL